MQDMVVALKSLEDFFGKNSLRSRRSLRGDLERRSLSISQEFIVSFTVVKQKLDDVSQDIADMAQACEEMSGRLMAARSQTSDLISKTSVLRNMTQQVKVKENVVHVFMQRFQLSADEEQVLTAPSVMPAFFPALERVKQIHENCKALLRTNQQQAGLSIMEAMSAAQETAFEKLYRWTQNACRSLSQELPEHTPLFVRALHALRNRPVLFQFSFNELSNARHNAVVRSFIDALTREGNATAARPMELHSHDPLRYCSDMLAWVHQCVASEKEQLILLLLPVGQSQLTHQRAADHSKGEVEWVAVFSYKIFFIVFSFS